MNDNQYRALVVDDEPLIRQLTMRALSRRGFRCEPASDGAQGAELAASAPYDVVVTDLQMPHQNGHALAVELLSQDSRPAVVVVTGLAEPKLAKDLLARGVDDILFKPVDFDVLSAKVAAIAQRRRDGQDSRRGSDPASRGAAPTSTEGDGACCVGGEGPRTGAGIDDKLAHLSKVLPVSQAALDVFNMTSSQGFDTEEIAAAIARCPSLSADILRLASSALYSPSGTKITGLEEAVVRIGQRRIGDLALATTTISALTTSVIPWLNVDLAWRRSIAAGVAADLLLEHTGKKEAESDLFLSAIMHPLGRIALIMLYPHEYQGMVRACAHRGVSLATMERRAFTVSHGEVLGLLLRQWEVSSSVYEPLSHLTRRYADLGALQEPLRTKAELLKLAVLMGRLAVDEWELWDTVEFPPAEVLLRFGIDSFAELLDTTKADAAAIVQFAPQVSCTNGGKINSKRPKGRSYELKYCNLSAPPFDFLKAVLTSTGFHLTTCEPDALDSTSGVLVNCISRPSFGLASLVNPHGSDGDRVIVTDSENADSFLPYGQVFQTPMAFGPLYAACKGVSAVG